MWACVPPAGVEPAATVVSGRCPYRSGLDGMAEGERIQPPPAATYARGESNPHALRARRSERRMSTRFHHEHVDRRGVEPRTSGLQSETVHQHPARRANGETRTRYLRLTRTAHDQSCCAGKRTPGRIRTGTVRPLRPLPLPLGYKGMCWERRIRTSTVLLQRQASCRLDQLPMGRRGRARRASPAGRHQRATSVDHDGARGVTRSGIRASAGVLSPLR
jgi:hypothetical protein